MAYSAGGGTLLAAAFAALSVDGVIHPLDTLITRMQSPDYAKHYKSANGSVNRALFQGLYQGFGPTLLMGAPSCAAFFVIYESLKSALHEASMAGHLQSIPQPAFHAISSVSADLVGCAILNPAEVLKQNAQVYRREGGAQQRYSPTLDLLKRFSRQPSKLWSGHTAFAASHVPGTALTMCLYEFIKETSMMRSAGKDHRLAESLYEHVRISALSAALAGACISGLLVPIDVVKTSMRLAAGKQVGQRQSLPKTVQALVWERSEAPRSTSNSNPLKMAAGIFQQRGMRGLFRGGALTCVAAAIGDGLYFGFYEGSKMYIQDPQASNRIDEDS